jgi:hypothetical protein
MLYLFIGLVLLIISLWSLCSGSIEEFKDLKETLVIYRLINNKVIGNKELDTLEEDKERYVISYKDLFFVTDVNNINEIYQKVTEAYKLYLTDRDNLKTPTAEIIKNIEKDGEFIKRIYSTINRSEALYIDENNTKYGIQLSRENDELIDLETGKTESITKDTTPDAMTLDTDESRKLLSFYHFAKRDYEGYMLLTSSNIEPEQTADGEYTSVPPECEGNMCYGDLKGSKLDNVTTSGSYNEVYGINEEEEDISSAEIQTGGISNASREEENITIPSVKELESKREKVDINEVRKELNLKPIDYEEEEDLLEDDKIIESNENVLSLVSPPTFNHKNTDFDKPGFYLSQDVALAMFSKLQQ